MAGGDIGVAAGNGSGIICDYGFVLGRPNLGGAPMQSRHNSVDVVVVELELELGYV